MAKKTKNLTLNESNRLRNALEQRFRQEFSTELIREGVKGSGESDEFKKLGAKIEDELRNNVNYKDERPDSGLTLSSWFKTLFYLTKEKNEHNFEYYALNKVCFYLEGVDADRFFREKEFFDKYPSERVSQIESSSVRASPTQDDVQSGPQNTNKYKKRYKYLIAFNLFFVVLGLLTYLFDYQYYNWLLFAPEPKHNIWVAVYIDSLNKDTVYAYNTFRTYRSRAHVEEYFYSKQEGDDDAFLFVTPSTIKKIKGYGTTKEFADTHGGKPMVFRLTGI